MIRHLSDITPVSTSHAVGQKRVLLSCNESGCSLTQIAVTQLRVGEVAVDMSIQTCMRHSSYWTDSSKYPGRTAYRCQQGNLRLCRTLY